MYDKIRSGTFDLLKSEKKLIKKNNNSSDNIIDENYNVGESIELDLETDQLNLFDEKN